MTDGLVAFITARLDEDEYAARGLYVEAWEAVRNDDFDWTVSFRPQPLLFASFGPEPLAIEGRADVWREDVANWIARQDPARMQREVTAKRGMLGTLGALALDSPSFADLLLTEMASAWSGHPDYRAEWKLTSST